MASFAAPGAPAPIPHILDVEEGLERLMGDQRLYTQLLRRFRQEYQPLIGQVRQAMAQGDVDGARRHIHSLKGATGMIGAQELHHLAGAAEQEFLSGSHALEDRLALVEVALAGLLRVLDVYLQEPAAAPGMVTPVPTPAVPEIRELLARLALLLDEGNGDAIELLEQSATALAAYLGVATFQEVAAAAHQFDFEGALAALQPALDS